MMSGCFLVFTTSLLGGHLFNLEYLITIGLCWWVICIQFTWHAADLKVNALLNLGSILRPYQNMLRLQASMLHYFSWQVQLLGKMSLTLSHLSTRPIHCSVAIPLIVANMVPSDAVVQMFHYSDESQTAQAKMHAFKSLPKCYDCSTSSKECRFLGMWNSILIQSSRELVHRCITWDW